MWPQGTRARFEGDGQGLAAGRPLKAASPSTAEAVTVRAYCSCGHRVDDHLERAKQCRATDEDGRCNCQSVDTDEAE